MAMYEGYRNDNMNGLNNPIDMLAFYGFKGISNKLQVNAVNYVTTKTKEHFGEEFTFTNLNTIDKVTKIIKEKYDKNFKKHVKYNNSDSDYINSTYIIKLCKATYLFISGKHDDKFTSLYLYFFGKKCYYYTREFKELIKDDKESTTTIYTVAADSRGDGNNNNGYWTCTVKDIISRKFDTLYFDNHIDDDIKGFLDKWLANEKIYTDRGLLFKTGILIYGTPGTGKSSVAAAIADYLNCNIISIDTASFDNINISEVTSCIDADEDRYVVLLDEIDTIFKSREDANSSEASQKRITKLLTFLDSVNSPNNVVFVATTNYVDTLDPAVTRKGRFDKMIEINGISKSTAKRMCEGFNVPEDKMKKILDNKPDIINPCDLQTEILENIKVKEESNL